MQYHPHQHNMENNNCSIYVLNTKIGIKQHTIIRTAEVFKCESTITQNDPFDILQEKKSNGFKIIGVEMVETATELKYFTHPEKCCYIFGANHLGLHEDILKICDDVISLPGKKSLHVEVAIGIVLYDRVEKLSIDL